MYKKLKELYYRFKNDGPSYLKTKGVKVGENCQIYTRHIGSEPWLITIGNNVAIAAGVFLLTHDGSTRNTRDERGRRYIYGKIVIEDNVFIGVNAIIMPGVKIEKNAIIAAGSIVTKSVPAGAIIAGNPARIIGDYKSFESQALKKYPAQDDLQSHLSFKENVNNVAMKDFKKYLIK